MRHSYFQTTKAVIVGRQAMQRSLAMITACLIMYSQARAQDQTVAGSLDVTGGPITLGTATAWSGEASSPTSPAINELHGLTIQFQDHAGWFGGTPDVDIEATFSDPDGMPYSGDEFWSWTDSLGSPQQQSGTSLTDYTGGSVDGYTSATAIVERIPGNPAEFDFGHADIVFRSGKGAIFHWQTTAIDGPGLDYYALEMMTLDGNGLDVVGDLHASVNLLASGPSSRLPNQTITSGSASIMTLGLSDERYMRKGETVAVTGTEAGGVGRGLIAGGTQFVSGKNNVGDDTALFIVGAGESTSSRRNALIVSSEGDTMLDGALAATGAASLSSTLAVAGATSLQALSAASASITGNASVEGDFQVGGTLFQFAGDSTTATLHSIQDKSLARWGWWKAGETEPEPSQPVMWLDEEHKLQLFPPAATTPAVVLDPAGNSSFSQPVRVAPGGDIPMGAYQAGDPP